MTLSESAIRNAIQPDDVADVLVEVKAQYGLGHDQQAAHLLEVLIETFERRTRKLDGLLVVENLVKMLVSLANALDAGTTVGTDADEEINEIIDDAVKVLRAARDHDGL